MTIYYCSTHSALKIHQSSNFKEMSDCYQIWENKDYTIVDKKSCFFTFKEAQSKLVEDIKEKIEKTQKKLKKLEKVLVAHTDIAKIEKTEFKSILF